MLFLANTNVLQVLCLAEGPRGLKKSGTLFFILVSFVYPCQGRPQSQAENCWLKSAHIQFGYFDSLYHWLSAYSSRSGRFVHLCCEAWIEESVIYFFSFILCMASFKKTIQKLHRNLGDFNLVVVH